jgi:uncharacterized protein (DUF1501 family)
MSKTTRRDFIKSGAGAIGAGMMLPVLNRTAEGTTIVKQLANNAVGNGNILVIVELAGGIDGLNVIVPYLDYDRYATLRPNISIPRSLLLPLNGSTTMRMAPELNAIKPIADAGKMAVVEAVGYPTPNLSHFSSRDIWYSAVPNASIATSQRTGWIGRHSALFGDAGNPVDTVSVSGSVNTTLYASGASAAGISNVNSYQFSTDSRYPNDRNNQLAAARLIDTSASTVPYVDLIEAAELGVLDSADLVRAASNNYVNRTGNHAGHTHVTYPSGGFGTGLQLIARLATSSPTLGTRVFYISTGGYDTHANQSNYAVATAPTGDLPRLLTGVASALKAFYDDLVAHNLQDQVVIMLWSEFGRRVAQNNDGTDHGTANNVILLGGRVRGGVYGSNGLGDTSADPSLTDLSSGNLKFKVDFRRIYATLIQDWLGGDPVPVLNGTFNPLGFIA